MDGDKEPMEFSLSEREIISTNLPTEKISNIFSKLQDTYTRQYKHQALIQRESKTFKLIVSSFLCKRFCKCSNPKLQYQIG